MKSPFAFVVLLAVVAWTATASRGLPFTNDDILVHYTFDETSGTTFADSGVSGNNGTFYRPLEYNELPAIDVANVSVDDFMWPLGRYIGIGTRQINYVDHQVMVDIPSHTNLPGAGDSFAVSFWSAVDDWKNSYGLIASYNLNGLEWSIGVHNSYDGIVAWTGDGDTSGTSYAWQADCSTLPASTLAHFVVQFEGTAGITNVYVNGTASTDGGNGNFWGNEREGFTLGGRALDARNYTVPSINPTLEDFAIIDGVVDATDVNNLMTSGASSLGSRRLAHYAMNDASGTQITDSSANANHGTLVGYDPVTMGSTVARDVSTATRAGVYGNATEFADHEDRDGRNERVLLSAEALPGRGEAFTVCFWLKPDENNAALYGWDTNGVILNWSNDPTPFSGTTDDTSDPDGLGFSVCMNTEGDGSMIVRRTSGNYISSVDQDTYGVYVGALGGGTDKPGLNLDPTEFHHFAVTVSETGDITAMYVDGELATQYINNGNGITDEGTAAIGARIKNGVIDSGLCAYLDDLAVLSGVLSQGEILQIMNGWTPPAQIPGDTNNDRIVDGTDAQKLAEKWGAPNQTGGASVGDFNNDGKVNAADAAILAANWGDHRATEGAAVPEPGALALLLAAGVVAAALRRRSA